MQKVRSLESNSNNNLFVPVILAGALLVFVVIGCGYERDQNNTDSTSAIDTADTVVRTDTSRCGEYYELIQYAGKMRNGSYLAFDLKGDTIISGNYVNDRRNGNWKITGYTPCIESALHPLSGLWYRQSSFRDVITVVNIQFSNDSLIHITELRNSIHNPSWLMTREEMVFGKDTVRTTFAWYESGALHSKDATNYEGMVIDTAWEWQENGTLLNTSLFDRQGKLIYRRYYDATGTKIISEEKGN